MAGQSTGYTGSVLYCIIVTGQPVPIKGTATHWTRSTTAFDFQSNARFEFLKAQPHTLKRPLNSGVKYRFRNFWSTHLRFPVSFATME
jgi:hypothetical protein